MLVVDDDPHMVRLLARTLEAAGFRVTPSHSAEEALRVLADRPFEVVVTDLRMPGMDGMELLATVTREWPGTQVIMTTAHASVPLAVEAMKAGAADFITKPVDAGEVVFAVRKAAVAARGAEDEAIDTPRSPGFVGQSPAIADAYRLLARAAQGTTTILIRGESGTGKDLAARAIHEQSPRRAGPFVKVHCAALPDALLESELFGYEKGAFTGAAQRKPGRVELAQGGTLFLDEIGDVPLSVQVKLLRVLQDREFERLGGTQTLKADVRFVAATHRDLEGMVERREFREDLFYRLSVVPIWLPPLRARPEDIGPLAAHFAATYGAANGRPGTALEAAAVELLAAEPWPGNVRQLQNFVERLVVLSDGPLLRASDVQRELARQRSAAALRSTPATPATPSAPNVAPAPAASGAEAGTLEERRREAEREALVTALDKAGNNRTLAARILGVSRRTLYNKLEEHKLL